MGLSWTLVLFIFLVSGWGQTGNDVNFQSSKFYALLRYIDRYYVDSTDIETLTEEAIIKVLEELDPHSAYINKDDVNKVNEPLKGNFEGVGIRFNILKDTLLVVQTNPGGPSEKVGLMPGDRIVKVDGKAITNIGLKNEDVHDLLRGPKGTVVEVGILRSDVKDLLEFSIIRDKIPINSLSAAYVIDDKIGYVKINRFAAKTNAEFEEAIDNLKEEGKIESLILDLRGNGGGYLEQAIKISDHFLEHGREIVHTKGLKSRYNAEYGTYSGNFEEGKLVILIDAGSASASEIVSGAIQDWDRGIIVGRRSFGKGLVQSQKILPDGALLRLTTAYYYTPSGRCIQKPFHMSKEDYKKDNLIRYESGELFNEDSIHVDEDLLYKTKLSNRDVYGGGGIIPDVFIPLDTSINYAYYNRLLRKNIVYPFVMNFVDKNRKKLSKQYGSFEKFSKKYEVDDNFLDELFKKGEEKEIERDENAIENNKAYIKRHLKATIASDMWDTEEFYKVMNTGDDEILKAVELLLDSEQYFGILLGNVTDK